MQRYERDPEVGEGTRGHYREYAIVYSGRAVDGERRGFRHAVNVRHDRTLCGRDCTDWFTEVDPFQAESIGCRSCRRSYERDERLAAESDAMG